MGLKPGELTALRDTTYLGSHPAASGQIDDLDVVFTVDGISLRRKRKDLGDIPWRNVTSLHAENREGVERRMTAPRLLLLGAWALVAKKSTILSYLIIADDRGSWLFAVPGLSAIELQAGLVGLQAYVPSKPASAPALPPPVAQAALAAPADPAARLEQLAGLRSKGLITEAEYDERRAAILNAI